MAEEQTTLPLGEGAAAPAAVAPAPAESAPSAEPAAAPVEAKVEEKPSIELTSEKPSLLEKEAPKAEEKTEAKADEIKPEAKVEAKGEEKPAEAKTETKPEEKPVEVKAEPVAYEYQLPETIKLDDATRGEFHSALDAFRQDPAKGAQGLIDLHNKSMQQYADSLLAEQHKAFNATRDQWAKDVMADEEIGGAGHQTAIKAIARMRDLLVSSAKPGSKQYEADQAALSNFLRVTGAGDHPVFLKMLHNAARYFDEPGLPPENPRPPADIGRAPGGRRSTLYDHPRSSSNRQ